VVNSYFDLLGSQTPTKKLPKSKTKKKCFLNIMPKHFLLAVARRLVFFFTARKNIVAGKNVLVERKKLLCHYQENTFLASENIKIKNDSCFR